MKIAILLNIEVKKGFIPALLNELLKSNCEVQKLECIDKSEDLFETYSINLVYSDEQLFNNVLDQIEKHNQEFRNINLTNILDEKINNGLIELKGKIELNNPEDYEINFSGLPVLLREKFSKSENPKELTSIKKNIALINTEKKEVEKVENSKYLNFSLLEKDSIFINKFAGYNCFPLFVSYKDTEDLLQNIKSIEDGFSAFRINKVIGSEDSDVYEQINDLLSKPVLFEDYDERVIFLLSDILNQLEVLQYKLNDCNIGFIGLNVSVNRLTRILKKMGCQRVLGFDVNNKYMMNFEKEGGMAITQENIFNNCDIVFLLENNFENSDLEKMRTGLIVYSLLYDLEIEEKISNMKECKKLIVKNFDKVVLLAPALIKAMVKGNIKLLDENNIIKISKYLVENGLKESELFDGIYDNMVNFLLD